MKKNLAQMKTKNESFKLITLMFWWSRQREGLSSQMTSLVADFCWVHHCVFWDVAWDDPSMPMLCHTDHIEMSFSLLCILRGLLILLISVPLGKCVSKLSHLYHFLANHIPPMKSYGFCSQYVFRYKVKFHQKEFIFTDLFSVIYLYCVLWDV